LGVWPWRFHVWVCIKDVKLLQILFWQLYMEPNTYHMIMQVS
jgi:hypothetical protein